MSTSNKLRKQAKSTSVLKTRLTERIVAHAPSPGREFNHEMRAKDVVIASYLTTVEIIVLLSLNILFDLLNSI